MRKRPVEELIRRIRQKVKWIFRGTAVEIVYATGGVEPVRWARVASVIRDRIVEICDCEGKTVAKGDVLARLDDREVQAQMKELRARENFLKNEMNRVSELITRGAATTQAYERASMDLQQVQGLISVQTERINDYTIVSPIDGIVLRRDGEMAVITVVDQGPGIPADKIETLGRPFVQVDDVLSRRQPGSGLGLAITRALAELHGGSLSIESRLGHGTRVSVHLPIDRLTAVAA